MKIEIELYLQSSYDDSTEFIEKYYFSRSSSETHPPPRALYKLT
jgi:hypothetical protein